MSDVMVTVSGYVGTRPLLYRSEGSGTEWTSFRVASTRRVVDRATGAWVDGATTWFTVKAWHAAARNVVESLTKGDPVTVHGRLSVDEWEGADKRIHTSLVVSATSVGPDCTRGVARFTRVITTSATSAAPDGGLPAPDGGGLVRVPAQDAEEAAAAEPWLLPGPGGEEPDGQADPVGEAEGDEADGQRPPGAGHEALPTA